jgi:DNA mismatch repair protein MutS2
LDEILARTYKSLEWERLKSFLLVEAESSAGQFHCQSLPLGQDIETVRLLLDETQEVVDMIRARSGLSAAGLPPLEESLQRLASGAALSPHDFLDLKTMLKIAHTMRTSIGLLPKESFPRITAYHRAIHSLPEVVNAIESVIDDGGGVADDASPTLRQLRREVQKLQAAIHNELTRIIHSSTLSKALQEPIYTQRHGRFVLPVNANMRNAIQGIVHDSSASGLTVYVEPMAVLELANKVRLKDSEIEREIARILHELGLSLQKHTPEIEENFLTVGKLDAISARARLSLKYNGCKPEISEQQRIEYKEARHPLLILQSSLAKVVANDIRIGAGAESGQTLVITGPNTGGKTVLLKTVGIFALMLRAGLLLPVSAGSVGTVFEHIFADIGDEQSLEQSLSTFSSHMQNIVHIVDRATTATLVLLDEIGAGTDPKEGAALAKSVLEHLTVSGAMTIATTHFSELKTLAYGDSGFINGSLDFDDVSLSPTYRLRLGIPGSSKATTIAARLGLNKSVIARANDLLQTSDQDLQQTIAQLESRMRSLQEREQELTRLLDENQRKGQELEEKKKDLEKKSESTRVSLANELETEFQISKEYIRHLIAELQKEPGIAKAQRVQKDLDSLRKELGWIDNKRPAAGGAIDLQSLSAGQWVRVRSLNQRGVVQETVPGQGRHEALVVVRAGSMNIKVPVSDLELVEGMASKVKKSASAAAPVAKSDRREHSKNPDAKSSARRSSARRRSPEEDPHLFVRTQNNTIDLRGQRVEEALANLERFIDTSALAEISPVMIIHGHGTGAVRNAVRAYLDTTAYGNLYRPGEMHEGGDGVTIVEFS